MHSQWNGNKKLQTSEHLLIPMGCMMLYGLYMTPKLYSMHVAGTPSGYCHPTEALSAISNTISLAWPRHSPQVANRPNAGRRQPTNFHGISKGLRSGLQATFPTYPYPAVPFWSFSASPKNVLVDTFRTCFSKCRDVLGSFAVVLRITQNIWHQIW